MFIQNSKHTALCLWKDTISMLFGLKWYHEMEEGTGFDME